MKKEDIEKWFRRVKLDDNDQVIYPIEYIEAKILTQENAKEFFFDFDCNVNNFIRDGIYHDWLKLNIPEGKITEWTTEYYSKDIKRYDEMSFSFKLSYCKTLSGLLGYLSKVLIIEISNKFVHLFNYNEITEIYDLGKRGVAQSMISYFKGDITYDHKISKERFLGYIPKLVEIDEHDLARNMLYEFIKFLRESPEAFYGNDHASLAYYYDILIKFNSKYDLDYQVLIDQIKPDTLYSGSYL